MSATFGGGYDAALALPWDELILRYVDASEVYSETWGLLARALTGRPR